VSHYKSNLRDIEFNLHEVLEIQDYLGSGDWADLDRETVDDILTEIERIATEDFAASYVDQDRIPLELVDGEITIPDSVKKSLKTFKEGGWNRLGLTEELGGTPVPPTVIWAMSEMLMAANTTAQFYAGGGLFARVLFEEGTEDGISKGSSASSPVVNRTSTRTSFISSWLAPKAPGPEPKVFHCLWFPSTWLPTMGPWGHATGSTPPTSRRRWVSRARQPVR